MAAGWQTGKIRIELNGPGIRELLRSEEVAADIARRGEAVAQQANGRYEQIPVGARDKGADPNTTRITAKVVSSLAKNRARTRVIAEHPAAAAVEARHRVLGTSIDAARS